MKNNLLFLCFTVLMSCSESNQSPPIQGEVYKEAGYAMDEVEDEIVASLRPQDAPISEEILEQKIIKTAQLNFETQKLAETHQKILQLTQQYKGIVQSDNSGKNYNNVFRNMTLRVPSEHFQTVVDGISSGVEYFDNRQITRQDVTEEFVDIQARLRAKKELENRYIQLLSQARTVKDMLEIERELSTIREEIEAKEGRLKFLENRVSMSTINVYFYTTTVETGVRVSYGQKMLNSLKGGWEGVSVFFLGILYLWPLFFFAIIIILVIRWLIRKNKKK